MFFLGFSRTTHFNIFSLCIRFFQGFTSYSHVYIRYYDIFYREWLIFEASHGEVHLIKWDNWSKKNTKVKEIPIHIEREELIKFVKYAYNILQVKYSVLNIIGIFLKRITRIKFFNDGTKGYICSELAARALKDKFKFEKDLDYITPKDIYKAVTNEQ